VGVEEVAGRVDYLGAFERDELAKLEVDAALGEPRCVDLEISFNNVGLHDLVHRVVELAEVMNKARITAEETLEAEAPIVLAGLGLEYSLQDDRCLIVQ